MYHKEFSAWNRFIDIISPRYCLICEERLGLSESLICFSCNLRLPRTNYHLDPFNNNLAKLFWGQINMQKATAFYFYYPGTPECHIIFNLKYFNRPDVGISFGRMYAIECNLSNFFSGIDVIIPVPITSTRLKQRGYNQSEMIAKGVSSVTNIPLITNAIRRKVFRKSQTKRSEFERMISIRSDFELVNPTLLEGKHILIVDDIITTGATILAVCKVLSNIKNLKVSVFALGYTKSP